MDERHLLAPVLHGVVEGKADNPFAACPGVDAGGDGHGVRVLADGNEVFEGDIKAFEVLAHEDEVNVIEAAPGVQGGLGQRIASVLDAGHASNLLVPGEWSAKGVEDLHDRLCNLRTDPVTRNKGRRNLLTLLAVRHFPSSISRRRCEETWRSKLRAIGPRGEGESQNSFGRDCFSRSGSGRG